MKKTPNFHLSQWDNTDRIMMNDFNEDNAKVEAALSALQSNKADQSGLTAANAALAALQSSKADAAPVDAALAALETKVDTKAQAVLGSYTGSGAASRTISLGFQPKAVLLLSYDGAVANGSQTYGGLALPGVSVGTASNGTALSITSSGFNIYYQDRAATNVSGYVYRYIAIR